MSKEQPSDNAVEILPSADSTLRMVAASPKPRPAHAEGIKAALGLVDYIPLGDGTFRAAPRKPVTEVSVRQAAKVANCPTKTIYRCLEAGFLSARRPSPRKILINMEELSRYLEAVKKPDFWTRERRLAFYGIALRERPCEPRKPVAGIPPRRRKP